VAERLCQPLSAAVAIAELARTQKRPTASVIEATYGCDATLEEFLSGTENRTGHEYGTPEACDDNGCDRQSSASHGTLEYEELLEICGFSDEYGEPQRKTGPFGSCSKPSDEEFEGWTIVEPPLH